MWFYIFKAAVTVLAVILLVRSYLRWHRLEIVLLDESLLPPGVVDTVFRQSIKAAVWHPSGILYSSRTLVVGEDYRGMLPGSGRIELSTQVRDNVGYWCWLKQLWWAPSELSLVIVLVCHHKLLETIQAEHIVSSWRLAYSIPPDV